MKKVDTLYFEATFSEAEKEKAQQYGHATARQAAELALRAQVKQLILGHFSARFSQLESLLAEAQEVFPNTLLAQAYLRLNIPDMEAKH